MSIKIKLGLSNKEVAGASVKFWSRDRLKLEKQLSPLAWSVVAETEPLEIYEVYDEHGAILGYYMNGVVEEDSLQTAEDVNEILEELGAD